MKSWLEKKAYKYIQHILQENLLLLKDRTLKIKIYRYMASVSKNYINLVN